MSEVYLKTTEKYRLGGGRIIKRNEDTAERLKSSNCCVDASKDEISVYEKAESEKKKKGTKETVKKK